MAEFHDTLNPVIWEKYKEGYVLKPEVKNKLKQIANAFIESLEINKEAVEDIVITGSMASYNYTPHSDIDLHLLIDFEKVHKDCPIVGDYLLSKKSEFNQKHDIFIYGIPVEVYAEAVGNDNVHNGLYSLENGWVDLPQKLKPTNNDAAVKAKYKEYKEAAEEIKDGDLAEKLLDKIKKMRKSGLAEGGEFSVENLVFKKLRDTGVIEKLMQVKKEGIDKKLSLKRTSEALSIMEQILDEMEGLGGAGSINTGTSVFAPYPVDVVGRDNPFKVKKEKRNSKGSQKKASLGYKYRKIWGKPTNENKGNEMDIFESLENLNVSEECYNEIVGLVEEIINELKDGVYRRGHDIAVVIAKEQEDNLANVKKAEDIEFVKDDIAKRRHQAAKMCDRRENQVIQRAAQKEAEAKAKKKKKKVDGSSEK